MEPLLTWLGHAADRQELQGSTSDNKCDPTNAFFAQLVESFNDEAFLPVIPTGWDKYDHMPKQKVYTLSHARDTIFLQTKWNAYGKHSLSRDDNTDGNGNPRPHRCNLHG
jgi:hypothetical protein